MTGVAIYEEPIGVGSDDTAVRKRRQSADRAGLPAARRGEADESARRTTPPDPGTEWLSRVSGECRNFLRVAAAVGMRFAPDDVARLLDRPTAALLPLVDEALGAGVLAVVGSLLTYRDERLWREATATVPSPMLHSLRQEAGAPLDVPASVEQPATGPAETVVPTTTVLSNARWDAGEPREALRFGREAVDAIGSDTPGPWRPHARLALAYKMVSLRELVCAESLIEQAQEETDRLGPGPHTTAPRVVRATLLTQTGRLAEARAEAQSAGATRAGRRRRETGRDRRGQGRRPGRRLSRTAHRGGPRPATCGHWSPTTSPG
jgi:hypothetical protein